MKSRFKTQMIGTQPAISKEAFLNFREARSTRGDQIHGWRRGLFSLFYFFSAALIWACVNPTLRPGPQEPLLFKGAPHLVSLSQWKHQSCDNNLVSPARGCFGY